MEPPAGWTVADGDFLADLQLKEVISHVILDANYPCRELRDSHFHLPR